VSDNLYAVKEIPKQTGRVAGKPGGLYAEFERNEWLGDGIQKHLQNILIISVLKQKGFLELWNVWLRFRVVLIQRVRESIGCNATLAFIYDIVQFSHLYDNDNANLTLKEKADIIEVIIHWMFVHGGEEAILSVFGRVWRAFIWLAGAAFTTCTRYLSKIH
jgi:hypothetical protein